MLALNLDLLRLNEIVVPTSNLTVWSEEFSVKHVFTAYTCLNVRSLQQMESMSNQRMA